MRFRSNKGFSIVEIMVAMSLLGALSLGIMKLMENMNKQSSTLDVKGSEYTIISTMRNMLINEAACGNSLRGMSLSSGTSVAQIKTPSDSLLYQVPTLATSSLRKEGIVIDSIEITNWQHGCGSVVDSDNPCVGTLVLVVSITRTKKKIFGGKTKQYKINLSVATIDKTTISSCYGATSGAVATAQKLACEGIGGTLGAGGFCALATSIDNPAKDSVAMSHSLSESQYVKAAGDFMTGNLELGSGSTANITLNTAGNISATNITALNITGTNITATSKAYIREGSTNLPIATEKYVNSLIFSNLSEAAKEKLLQDLVATANNNGVNAIAQIAINAIAKNNCPVGEYMAGTDTTGAPECIPLPIGSASDCPADQYIDRNEKVWT